MERNKNETEWEEVNTLQGAIGKRPRTYIRMGLERRECAIKLFFHYHDSKTSARKECNNIRDNGARQR